MTDPRLVSARATDDDAGFDQSLRPRSLDEYVGQPQVVANLRVAIEQLPAEFEALVFVDSDGRPAKTYRAPRRASSNPSPLPRS